MNNFLTFMMLMLVVAILQLAVKALVVTLILALIFSFITRPRDTLIFLASLGLFGLAGSQPIACIIALTVIALMMVLVDRRQKRLQPHRLAHHHQDD